MATECTQDAILDFLKKKGGKVKNKDFIEHFKTVFPEDPKKKADARDRFKNYVDNVAFVKTESGVKYVCLKKKFRGPVKENQNLEVNNGSETELVPNLNEQELVCRYAARAGNDAAEDEAQPRAAGREVQQHITPGSGYGNDSQVSFVGDFPPSNIVPDDKSKCQDFVCVVEEVDSNSGEMGNRGSVRRGSSKDRGRKAPDIPEITVIEASPLPAEGSMFTLPGPAQTGCTGQVDTSTVELDPRDRQVPKESISSEGVKQAERVDVVVRRRSSKGSQLRSRLVPAEEEGEDEGQLESHSLSESENSPKASRKHFIEAMMNSSPQLRRSLVLRSSVCLSSRSDSDSVSIISSNLDDDRASVTLDPLEHEWMMCASDGEWGSLHRLLSLEPSLILRKDFVTGFTCLHWAAKHGKPELLALIVNFAKQHGVPVSIDVRSNTGYTPLHIAAMHNHMEVVKLLVGAYNADVEVRDYSGRKACQYLTDNVSVDIRDIIGAYERSDPESKDQRDGGRWRFSKVLTKPNLKPLRLLTPNDCDSIDGDVRLREKPVRRKSSFSRMKPKLERLRVRTSQIVHSTSFRDWEDLEKRSERGSFKSRPKTHFFG
ncbi:uncharacterized protein V6R79_006006 [Siganus canaliculatus]